MIRTIFEWRRYMTGELLNIATRYHYSYGSKYNSIQVANWEWILYIALIIIALISIIASIRVNSVFNKYNKVPSMTGFTGATAAQRMLQYAGVLDVTITVTPGKLTDHYDPRNKTLYLSREVFYGNSIAAIGVAAHESGHAMQHHEAYGPLVLRSKLVPVAKIGSTFGIWIAIIGLVIAQYMTHNATLVMDIGIILFSAAVLFQLVTLPVEFDASRRAIKYSASFGVLTQDEQKGCRAVLGSAAMTYVAAAAASVIQLLRLIVMRNNSRR